MIVSRRFSLAVACFSIAVPLGVCAQQRAAAPAESRAPRDGDPRPAPARHEGDGPFARLIIRGATLIDGTGAPPRGPVDIVIEQNRIAGIVSVGVPRVAINDSARPRNATREIDAAGMYVMPGFVDIHVHQGTQQKAPDAEYYNKLWLAHGITTVRGVPFASPDWSVAERDRSARNEITAPRMWVYQIPGTGWTQGPVRTGAQARAWVQWAAKKGIDGAKLGLGAEPPEVFAAVIDEAKKNHMGTVAHLAQSIVGQMNAIQAARLGLGTLTHYYGLFESMYDSNSVQPWPSSMNYNDEQDRFGQSARNWNLVTPRGEKWNALLKEFRALDVTLDPTMTAYLTARDMVRRVNEPWHAQYTLPSLWDYYTANRLNHGSFYYYWTTSDEVAWRNFYRVWMQFLNDYKNMGGRVTASSDAGFIYNTPGFSTIEEMELLQEAGFHPLEVIRSATMYAAQTLYKPTGREPEIGIVRTGMLADLAIVDQNPIENLKVLYGTGWPRLDDRTGKVEQIGGIRYTVKDGILYDARALLADVAQMVSAQRTQRAKAGK